MDEKSLEIYNQFLQAPGHSHFDFLSDELQVAKGETFPAGTLIDLDKYKEKTRASYYLLDEEASTLAQNVSVNILIFLRGERITESRKAWATTIVSFIIVFGTITLSYFVGRSISRPVRSVSDDLNGQSENGRDAVASLASISNSLAEASGQGAASTHTS